MLDFYTKVIAVNKDKRVDISDKNLNDPKNLSYDQQNKEVLPPKVLGYNKKYHKNNQKIKEERNQNGLLFLQNIKLTQTPYLFKEI